MVIAETTAWMTPRVTNLVERTIGAPSLCLHYYIGMKEVGRNHIRHEGCVLILEDHGHNVIPDVPLALQLNTETQTFRAMGFLGGGQGGA